MQPPLDIKQRFPPEDQPIAGHLGKFIISFVQSLLKIGHFQSGDAKSATAKEALFEEWNHLAQTDREVSLIIRNPEKTSEVFVYGILSEITPLSALFSHDMAGFLMPKVVDYFNRHYLSGFTLKPGMALDEFDRLIEIMHAPINPADIDHAILEVTEKLVSQQVVHAALIYQKEMLTERSPLHFMTQMALTRFEKECNVLLLHLHLTEAERFEKRNRVFQDILLPLSDVAVLKEILIHTDLIEISGWRDRVDPVIEIGKGVGRGLLWKFLLEAANTLKGIPPLDRSPDDRLTLVVQKTVFNLTFDKMQDDSEETLEILLQEKVVTLLEIPEPVLDRVYLQRKTNDYLENKERYGETIQEGGNDLIPILPVLLKRNEFLSFGELFNKLRTARKEVDAEFLAQVKMESMRGTILSKMQDHHVPNRKDLFAMLEPLSLFFYKSLLPFCADEDILLRRNICKIFVAAGEIGISDLIAFANDPCRHWHVLRNVVMMLGEIGSSEERVLTFLKRCHRHPNLRVREEVIVSLGKIKGAQAAVMLLKELSNPDMTIRSRAVSALGNFHPMDTQYQKFMEEVLKKKRKHEPEADEQVQVACCAALETIAHIDPMAAQYFEPILCDALMPDKPALFGLMGEKHHDKGYEVKKAICRVLGEIGTKSAFPLVGRLITEKYWHPEDRALIQQMLQKIERRMGVGE